MRFGTYLAGFGIACFLGGYTVSYLVDRDQAQAPPVMQTVCIRNANVTMCLESPEGFIKPRLHQNVVPQVGPEPEERQT